MCKASVLWCGCVLVDSIIPHFSALCTLFLAAQGLWCSGVGVLGKLKKFLKKFAKKFATVNLGKLLHSS